jgi:chromosome segregation ATPase
LTATTGQTALDVIGMTTRQEAMQSALRDHSETWGAQMARLANGQQQVQNSLDTLTATAGQTALDVMAVTTGQEAIRTTLQSHDQVSATQVAKLAANQQQIQNSVDIVTATTGQASLDAIALGNRQEQLGQAVRAGQQETADRLAAITQSQQGWSDRLDAAQAKITTMTGDLAALERQIGTLQTALRAGLQDTTTLLGATDEQRLQFETKVSQDVQAVIEALGQLRQMQASLQEQIIEVHKSTLGQADSLRSVLEQIRATPNVTDGIRPQVPPTENQAGVSAAPRPAAEVRVSSAVQKPQVPEAPRPPEATE